MRVHACVCAHHQAGCLTCRAEVGRHSKSVDTEKQRCGKCHGKLELLPHLLADGTPAKPRAPSAWQLFCKQHMAEVKAANPSATHKEVMGTLSERYKLAKA